MDQFKEMTTRPRAPLMSATLPKPHLWKSKDHGWLCRTRVYDPLFGWVWMGVGGKGPTPAAAFTRWSMGLTAARLPR